MKVVTVAISDAQEGQELAEDLFVDGCKLLSKGRKLTIQIIKILRNRKIEFLQIVQLADDEKVAEEEISIDEIEVDLNYLDSLSSLNIEARYGLAAQNEKILSEIFEIYSELEQQPAIRQLLMQLKNFDTYTFLHSLDVFTLGTLFAKHLNLPMLKRIALGYLLHDVGKLTIPQDVLNKPGKLTRLEFDTVKAHTTEGEMILRRAGFGNIAYFANLHHERYDGSGYPNGLKGNMMSAEIALLTLIDTYSALTLRRSYRKDKNTNDAMTIICKDRHLFKEDLLYSFINFIGIYPEGSKVLLTNGQEVYVHRSNPNYPLLPQVKCAVSGNIFNMPVNFTNKIRQILSFEPDTKEETCNKLFDFLIGGKDDKLNEFYEELSEQYQPHELYLRVIIPIYKSLMVLKEQNVLPAEIILQAIKKLNIKIQQTNRDLGIINKREKTFIIVLPRHYEVTIEMLILEGLLHVDGIYPIIAHDAENKAVLRNLSAMYPVSGMVVFDNSALNIDYDSRYKVYDLTYDNLTEYVERFNGIKQSEFDVLAKLERYERKDFTNYGQMLGG